ncbi:MAG: molybdopterin-guanine dinucleotide biosynthesis protein B [Candidatus Bathyarchaeota archaeon]|nr:molybdopterin-guanine dinucleotide biosynthesis protein B [Candidatus Bathyarchaeota archaeon]
MPKVIAVVGGKHSGKTTIIEHLITEFKRRGYHVGTIKEMVKIPTLDTPQTETDRYTQAGAEVIAAVPRTETVVFIKKRLDIGEILPYFEGLDFVFLEGFESEDAFCRVIAAKTVSEAQSFMDKNVLAISGVISASEDVAVVLGVPVFNVLTQVAQLADLIEHR